MAKRVHFFLGIGGAAFLFWMIHKIGFESLKENLLRFGLGSTLFLVLLYALAQIAFCAAWFVILPERKKVGFWRTFAAYAAGDALNMTIPSGNLAGEPVKIMLLKDRLPAEQLLASVTVYKFADFVSLTLFLLAGWLFHFAFYDLPGYWNLGAGLITFGMAAASVLFFVMQKKGVYLPLGKLAHKLGLEKWVEDKLHSAHLVDESVRAFYLTHRNGFALSVFFNFIAWFGGVLEIMIFMKWMGLESSFPAALTIETFSLFVNNISFFVPARIGVGEGARTVLFMALGFSKGTGLTYGIIRRIRELAWVGAGLSALALRRK